eukprot:12937855-Prorocentrum_lima.AAC.1
MSACLARVGPACPGTFPGLLCNWSRWSRLYCCLTPSVGAVRNLMSSARRGGRWRKAPRNSVPTGCFR